MWNKLKNIFGSKGKSEETSFDEPIMPTQEESAVEPEYTIETESIQEDAPAKSVPHNELTGLSIADAILQISTLHGTDIITSGSFINALADYGAFAENRAASMVVKFLKNDGLLTKLISLGQRDNIPNEISNISQRIISNYGMQQKLVDSVLWEMAVGLNLTTLEAYNSHISSRDKEQEVSKPSNEAASAPAPTNPSSSPVPPAPQGDYNPESELRSYRYPSKDILKENKSQISQDVIDRGKERIIWTLESHGIPVDDIIAYPSHRVTLYEIKIDAKKAGRISRLEKEILASLGQNGCRIINPLPGKFSVGIELPNEGATADVCLGDLIKSNEFDQCDFKLPLVLGVEPSGKILIKDLTSLTHLLICGEMQQGKTSILRQIIASLLFNIHPSRVRFTFIDTCSLDLQDFRKLDSYCHALLDEDSTVGTVYDSSKAMEILNTFKLEMDNRQILLKAARVSNIEDYNKEFCHRKLNPAEGHRFLPYLILICDEYSSLLTNGVKAYDTMISSLLPKAANVGIHCIFTTKHSSVDTLTQTMRANFPAKIALRIPLVNESRLVVGNNQANALLPNGDFLFSVDGNIARCQAAKCDTYDIMPILEEVGKNNFPLYSYILPDVLVDPFKPVPAPQRDPLFEDVGRFVVSSGLASTSSIQRRYVIGYNRAGKIMDELEAAGVVGPAMGGKPRSVLMTLDEFNKLF